MDIKLTRTTKGKAERIFVNDLLDAFTELSSRLTLRSVRRKKMKKLFVILSLMLFLTMTCYATNMQVFSNADVIVSVKDDTIQYSYGDDAEQSARISMVYPNGNVRMMNIWFSKANNILYYQTSNEIFLTNKGAVIDTNEYAQPKKEVQPNGAYIKVYQFIIAFIENRPF